MSAANPPVSAPTPAKERSLASKRAIKILGFLFVTDIGRFILKRLGFIIPQLLIVVIGTFFLLRALPVDPTSRVVGFVATDEARAQARATLGIDVSQGEQLWRYLKGLILHFDFGVSWNTQDNVWTEIAQRFPVTIQLTVLAFIVSLLIAIPVGRAAAAKPGKLPDKLTLGYSLFAGAQPDFWWGLMFVYIFFFLIGWFPAPLGQLSPEISPPDVHTRFTLIDALIAGHWEAFADNLHHYGLPVITLAFVLTGPLIKMTRQSVLSVVNSDYILYAKAAGYPAKTIRWYMLRNSLSPVITLSGILFGFMLGGAVLIETVFSLDGLGVYSLQRTLATDFPAIQGAVVVMTAFSLLIYLLMDIVYAVLDPRVRYGGTR
jgi:ABC-type dipeptide/oligopeptide/nickel transport system permease component